MNANQLHHIAHVGIPNIETTHFMWTLAPHLTVDADEQDHKEEERRPHGGPGQLGDRLGVRHEHQTWAWCDHE